MRRNTFMYVVLLSVFFTAMSTSAADKVSATRGGLRHAVDLYIEAQTKGDISGLPLGTMMSYKENMEPVDIKKGIINKPMEIDFHRSLYDTYSGQTFTEVIVTNKEKPYVIGTRMRINHDKIAEIDILWTTTDYWLFDADAYLKYSSSEDWSPVAQEKRETRGTLIAAANAYLDAFLEGKIDLVPWGFPCVRIEGGAYTGTGSPDDSCEVGVPSGLNITNRSFLVDEVINSVVVFCTFGIDTPDGQSGSADTHLFRVENGTLRYVHTLTHLLMSDFRGELPKEMPKQ